MIYGLKKGVSAYKNGWYIINGKRYFFRSEWEVYYARYLDFLKARGEVIAWEYEADTFWFEKIRRGVRSYTPDFKIVFKGGLLEYHEVKGYLDPKSITKLKRMKKYHPHIKLVLIYKSVLASIIKYERMFPEAKKTAK